jgi:hypothetical protein
MGSAAAKPSSRRSRPCANPRSARSAIRARRWGARRGRSSMPWSRACSGPSSCWRSSFRFGLAIPDGEPLTAARMESRPLDAPALAGTGRHRVGAGPHENRTNGCGATPCPIRRRPPATPATMLAGSCGPRPSTRRLTPLQEHLRIRRASGSVAAITVGAAVLAGPGGHVPGIVATVLGVFGVSGAAVQARAKNTTNDLLDRLRHAMLRNVVASAMTHAPTATKR